MKTRQELQNEAIATVLRDRNVIVNWGTGVGKSRVAIGVVDELARRGEAARVLLLVAEISHKDNWYREFTEALGQEHTDYLWRGMSVECYASLPKYEWSSWDIVIADEAHHLRSENRTDTITTVAADYFLCLTATMSCDGDADDLLRMLEMSHGEFRQLDFGIQDAIDNDILKEPTIYAHFLCLDDFKIRQEIVEKWGGKDRRVILDCDFEDRKRYTDRLVYPAAELTIRATPRQAYDYYTEKIDCAKTIYKTARSNAGLVGDEENEYTEVLKTRIKHFGNLRKTVLGQSKTTFTKWLLEKRLEGMKYVCFCASVDQAKDLGGDYLICSENGSGNAETIAAFNEDRSDRLFAVGMAKEGLNLKGIEAGVVVQLGGKERDFVQQIGRAFRSDNPIQHIVVIAGTRDEDYYENDLTIFKSKYIHKKYYGQAVKYKDVDRAAQMRPVENPSLPGLARVGGSFGDDVRPGLSKAS